MSRNTSRLCHVIIGRSGTAAVDAILERRQWRAVDWLVIDFGWTSRFIQRAKRSNDGQMDVNCWDPLGRSALIVAIDNENLEMVELLVIMGVATKDALLHAINKEFVEAVELLLEHEEIFHKEGTQYVRPVQYVSLPNWLHSTCTLHAGAVENVRDIVDRFIICCCRVGRRWIGRRHRLLLTWHRWSWRRIATITKSSRSS